MIFANWKLLTKFVRSAVACLTLFLLLAGCQTLSSSATEKSRTTDTQSSKFESSAERIEFLRRYLTLPTAVEDAHFHIVFHDNASGGFPGPSDWDIQAVIKVAPSELSHWREGLVLLPASQDDLAWGYALLPDMPAWNVSSAPELFQGAGSNHTVAIFAAEGVVFERTWTQ